MSLIQQEDISREKSGVVITINKKVRMSSGGVSAPVPTDIVGEGKQLQLYKDGEPLKGQTPQKVKTVGGQSIFGEGDIPLTGGGTLPSRLSQFENDTGFVTNTVSDLEYYYTKNQIEFKLEELEGIKILVVEQLPTSGKENILYMLSGSNKIFAQYF